jgi:hypothetical protein
MTVARSLALLVACGATAADAGTAATVPPTAVATARPTVSPTYNPTKVPTPAPTPEPTPSPTACVCEDQRWTFDGARCARGCGVAGATSYGTMQRCCNKKFVLDGNACVSWDMCAPPTPEPTPKPTPAPTPPPTVTTANPTSGSTPTVGTWNSAPPTPGNAKTICLIEQDCEMAGVHLGLTEFRADETFATKGCFTKNGKAFWSAGTVAEMLTVELTGVQVPVYCPGT